jgi:hypothetical protein
MVSRLKCDASNPHVNTWRALLLAALITCVSVVGSAEAANASPGQPAAGASMPRCVWATTYQIGGTAPTVYWWVFGRGFINQVPDLYCGSDYGWTYLQKKVCGFWGCNFHTQTSYQNSVSTAYWFSDMFTGCGSGTNRWRVSTTFRATLFDPAPFSWYQSGNGPEAQLTC